MNHEPDLNLRRERVDLILNAGAIGFIGLGGLGLIALIGGVWGSEGVGLFTELLAIWIIAAQFGVLGIQTSALRSTSIAKTHLQKREAAWTAVFTTCITGGSCALLVAILADPIANAFGDEGLTQALTLASPGILLFSLNKVLIFSLNGLRHMRLVAVANALRMVILLFFTGLLFWFEIPIENLGLAMTAAEMVVFLVAGSSLALRYKPCLENLAANIRSHVSFGSKALPGGAILELNTRVDVLTLGLLVEQDLVGVYGYALAFAEGHQQIAVVFRNQFNPRIAGYLVRRDRFGLKALFRNGGRTCLNALLVTALMGVVGLPLVLMMQPKGDEFASAPMIFAIIATGTVLGGRWLPFSMIQLQGGRPGAYSRLVFNVLIINVLANLTLIPFLGIFGAAIGTSISLIAMGLLSRAAMGRVETAIQSEAAVADQSHGE